MIYQCPVCRLREWYEKNGYKTCKNCDYTSEVKVESYQKTPGWVKKFTLWHQCQLIFTIILFFSITIQSHIQVRLESDIIDLKYYVKRIKEAGEKNANSIRQIMPSCISGRSTKEVKTY